MAKLSYDEILDYEYEFEDAGVNSLREYFYILLKTLWNEGEGFDGKRPFGNSAWEYDVYSALVDMQAVTGKFDYDEETGERYGLSSVDKKAANSLTFELISHIFKKDI